jgi:hypothetical protein
MICKSYNQNIRDLIMVDKSVLWKCKLSNGEEAWSDFIESKDPWTKLRRYCNNNNINILEVRVIALGIREQVVFENKDGLDGIIITGGMSKDITSDDSITFNYLAFGLLNKVSNKIEVKKFFWPECEFDTYEEIREITPENKNLIYYKIKNCGDKCKCQEKEAM